jgi:hypothetical protein
VTLQVNTSGSWRDVISFDAAKDIESAEVGSAAETLGRISKASFCVLMTNSPQLRSPGSLEGIGRRDRRARLMATRSTKPTSICRVSIDHRDYLMPADKGMKLVELLQPAVECRRDYAAATRCLIESRARTQNTLFADTPADRST